MTYAEFKVELDRFIADSRERRRRWEEKYGRPDPRIAREKLAKMMADLEASMKK